jgi:hypothetical protein
MIAAGEAGHVAGSRQHLALQDQGAGGWWGQDCAFSMFLMSGLGVLQGRMVAQVLLAAAAGEAGQVVDGICYLWR